jgi:hypothetical protein
MPLRHGWSVGPWYGIQTVGYEVSIDRLWCRMNDRHRLFSEPQAMRRVVASLAMAFLTCATPAIADTFATANVSFEGAMGDVVTASNEGVYAGPYAYYIDSVVPKAAHSGFTLPSGVSGTIPKGYLGAGNSYNYLGFCIEFNQNISVGGPWQFNVEDLTSALTGAVGSHSNAATAAADIESLASQFIDAGGDITNPSPLLTPQTSPLTRAQLADALSLGIWEVLSNVTTPQINGGTSGDISASTDPSVIAEANSWLSLLGSPLNHNVLIYGLGSDTLQNQSIMFAVANPNITTPEPAELIGLGGVGIGGLPIGLGLLFARKRRHRVTAQSSTDG